jgi:hypothetical protein
MPKKIIALELTSLLKIAKKALSTRLSTTLTKLEQISISTLEAKKARTLKIFLRNFREFQKNLVHIQNRETLAHRIQKIEYEEKKLSAFLSTPESQLTLDDWLEPKQPAAEKKPSTSNSAAATKATSSSSS